MSGVRPGFQREACRICGRWGSDDPAQTCNQAQDVSGEYECRGDAPWDEDDEGFFIYPTAAMLDDWSARLEADIAQSEELELANATPSTTLMEGEGR